MRVKLHFVLYGFTTIMIEKSVIDTVIERADIVEVISDFVHLTKKGKDYKGLCPFHDDKNPSMSVSPSRGIYKCFSCGAAGNAVKFVMEHEHYSFIEAIKYLANKYHIEIIEREETEEDRKKKTEKESLEAVTLFAHKFFTHNLLETEEGKNIGLSYFQERGFTIPTIKKFGLGYSPDSRDAFSKAALHKGYKTEYLIATGLSIQGRNNQLFDRFAGRVIFPIHAISGKVIAFGGRTLKNEKAKYLNSPESVLYHKSDILYGLFFAKKAISKEDKCFLVEGYTDVISMHQNGIENVVASSGTALTEGQIRKIKRFTNNITVLYDGDEAGIKAALRGIDLILKEGLNVKVLALPDGEDPDSFAKSHSASEFKEYIEQNESDFVVFKAKLLLEKSSDDPVKKAGAIQDIVSTISIIPDKIMRTVYIKECAKILDINEKVLFEDVRNKIYSRNKLKSVKQNFKTDTEKIKKDGKPAGEKPENTFVDVSFYELEKEIVSYILKYGDKDIVLNINNQLTKFNLTEYIYNELNNDDIHLTNSLLKQIFDEAVSLWNENKVLNQKYFVNHENADISDLCINIVTTPYQLSKIHNLPEGTNLEEDNLSASVPKTVLVYKTKIILNKLEETEKLLEKAQKENDEEKMLELMMQITLLNQIKIRLADAIGRVLLF